MARPVATTWKLARAVELVVMARLGRGYQSLLAEAMGISPAAVNQHFSGLHPLSESTIHRIGTALDLPYEEMLANGLEMLLNIPEAARPVPIPGRRVTSGAGRARARARPAFEEEDEYEHDVAPASAVGKIGASELPPPPPKRPTPKRAKPAAKPAPTKAEVEKRRPAAHVAHVVSQAPSRRGAGRGGR